MVDVECGLPLQEGGRSATQGLLWESVLRRSLKSGDPERVIAAIGLAEEGGACTEVLAFARIELRRLHQASLESATRSAEVAIQEEAEQQIILSCAAKLVSGIECVEEARAAAENLSAVAKGAECDSRDVEPTRILHQARMALQLLALFAWQRVAVSALECSSESLEGAVCVLEQALQVAARDDADVASDLAVKLQEARRQLRRTREALSPEPDDGCVQIEVAGSRPGTPCRPRTPTQVISPAAARLPAPMSMILDPDEEMGCGGRLGVVARRLSPARRTASPGRVAPMMVGRSSYGNDEAIMEGGLSVHVAASILPKMSTASTTSKGGASYRRRSPLSRKGTAATGSNTSRDECALQ